MFFLSLKRLYPCRHTRRHASKVTRHQQLHAEVESLRQEVRAGEKRVQDCAQRLTQAEAALRGPLGDAKRLLEAGRKAEAGKVLSCDASRTARLSPLAVSVS